MRQDWLTMVASALRRQVSDPLVVRIATLVDDVQNGRLPPEQAQATLDRDLSTAGAGPVLSFAQATVGGNITLRDVAGRDIVTVTVVQLPAPPLRAAPFFALYPPPVPGTLVGRDTLVVAVRDRLCAAGAVRLALEGMPGVGKTRLATELAYDVQVRAHFSGGVFMTSLGQQPDLEDRLNQWARALGVELHPRLNLPERVEQFAAVLTRIGRPCLLIIDDVWTTEHARVLLFGSPHAVFLFTSRQRDQLTKPVAYDQLLGPDNLLVVPPLETGAAATLLQQQAQLDDGTHRAELEALAVLVGGLPLLLNAMGGRLAEVRQQKAWFAEVLNELQQASARLSLSVRSIEQTRANMRGGWLADLRRKPIEKSLSASAVIELSIARLPHDAKELFIRLAALPSDPFSFGPDAARAAWEQSDDRALRLLAQRNLLIETPDGRFRMHRVLWDWAESKHYSAVKSARQYLADWHAKLPTADNSEEFLAWAKHPDNWRHMLQTWRNALDDPNALRSCIRTIVPLLIRYGYWNALLEGLEQALRTFKHVDRGLAAEISFYLSSIYYQRAEYQQSRRYATDALRGSQEVRNPIGQGAAYSLIGMNDQATGDYVSARSAYEAALALIPEEDERNYAACLNNLAVLLRAQGDYTAAQPLHERALQIEEQALGPTHPDTANSLNNLAVLLDAQRDYTAAQPLVERALEIREQALGPTHPDTLAARRNLAAILSQMGPDAQAAECD